MTFRRIRRGKWWSYEIDGHRVAGVTTMIGKAVPKPALIDWSARMSAEWAVDNIDTIARMDRAAAVDAIKGAANRSKNFAGAKGTAVHGYAQRIAHGDKVQIPDELVGYVDGYLSFIEDWQPETIAVEAAIANRTRRYAGTFDLLARLRGELVSLIDIKTSGSGVWPETCLQIAAYRNAEVMLDADGREVPMPVTDAGHALWLGDDGTYELLPVESGDDIYRAFLHACALAKFMERAKDDLIGLPLSVPEVIA
jgi:hypothetical protein